MKYSVIFVCNVIFVLTVSGQNCFPDVDCSTLSPQDTVPDPLNCEKFYICLSDGNGKVIPSTVPFSCPEGQFYNVNNSTCQPEYIRGICDENYCGQILAPVNPGCAVTCPEFTPSFIADAHSCSIFYQCLPDGTTLPEACSISPNLYYDGKTCQADITQCCDFDNPFCFEAATQVPDPFDCTAYYFCPAADEVPSQSYRYTCTEGTHYNATTYKCDPGTCGTSELHGIAQLLPYDEHH